MRVTQLLFLGLIGTALPVQFVNADADGEREMLARIVHEIEAIHPLIRQAASQANPDVRIRFQYDWLRQDLDQIQRGIQEHIDAPRAEPRTFPPLHGDYRR
ncbi:RAQPRD family integrative conjugative element protein [Sedimenticola selenatireducens]|uniref:integrative conjugative element protein, RAQPRD family n=1 Tax=Sedimenticola selenatireducens TaxID=191960 RepID=UPI0004B5E324|nr:RAQPRD family integrative conjugative element protein [Sedimenticola selenatireducens]